MKPITLLFLLSLALLQDAPAQEATNTERSITLEELQTVSKGLTNGTIKRVEILYFPTNILTYTRITPAWLQINFYYKLVIADIPTSQKIQSLAKVIPKIRLTKSSWKSELRWGCLFYGSRARPELTIFLDRTGTNGVMGSQSFMFDDQLHRWLISNVADCFQ